eukprot:CAMPEP_0184971486 /NCGR_PEP_ID=MMETSP1098-20130426/3712_1 /TAXON_ID=89044 /ORGANISM="Spumella elongata, Strain CCAP 955/1" /LENGTH=503 /DNA_ID=CAMNT_0027493617 /DNA_START=31 /DNA_END=1542 /DNA_ORIENTATION=-
MIDSYTSVESYSVTRKTDGRQLSLVMSDEFEVDGRQFGKGKDKLFEAIEKPDNTNEAIQFYNSSSEYVTTGGGSLLIMTKAVKTNYVEWDSGAKQYQALTKNYTSGMIQSWNKFCFTGGILEMSIELPGEVDSGGLWPAAWLMGNLARATFEKSTMHVWPWSYNKCGAIQYLDDKQEVNACMNEPGFGLRQHQGRGAPEIDIFEVMPGHEMPGTGPVNAFMSSSLQVAPGISKTQHRPVNGKELNSSYTWYDDIEVGKHGKFNSGFWGQECGPEHDPSLERRHKYMEDAISVNTDLKATHFKKHHKYTLEWQPGPAGYLHWYLDDVPLLGIKGASLEKLTGAMIPEEPMYLILNTAISHRWGFPEPCPADSCSACWHCFDCTNPECQCALPEGMKGCRNLPAAMRVDYIRLYQDAADPAHSLSCSPASHPTKQFIEGHIDRYRDWTGKEPFQDTEAFFALKFFLAGLLGLFALGFAYKSLMIILARRNREQYVTIPNTYEDSP